jgi:hypothetical protein
LANEEQPGRTLNWERTDATDSASPLEQHLADGWLYSRTPTQFITARIRTSAERLEIQSNSNGQLPRVVNHLGTSIKRLLLVDENDVCSTAADVASDATVTLQMAESQSSAFLQQLQPLWNANLTEVSVVVPSGNSDLFGFRRQQYDQNRYAMGIPVSNASAQPSTGANTGMLERSLADTQDQLMKGALPARTYVAIVESSPEVQWGTPAARPEESLHIIVGQW